jgi:hypothetical protein
MTIETINIGNAANDGTGDDLREAFIKVNQNFQDIDARTEQTTATNLGLSGYQVFANQSGSQLQFRRLLAGTNVELVQTDTTIRIDAPTQPTSFVVSGDTGSLIAGAGINLAVVGGEGITIGVDNNNKRITVNGGLALDLSPSLAAGLDGNNKNITNVNNLVATSATFPTATITNLNITNINGEPWASISEYLDYDFGTFSAERTSILDFIVKSIGVDFGTFTSPANALVDFGSFV